jgi:SP family sugar:H+ symporter-like MFS transporter
MLPSLGLQIGMFFMPYSPRWLVEKNRDEEAKKTLSYLRSRPQDDADVMIEYLEIKAEVLAVREIEAARSDKATSKFGKFIRPYRDLVSSKANAKRLFIGSVVMFYQQFIGCNAIIYYAPTSQSRRFPSLPYAYYPSLC